MAVLDKDIREPLFAFLEATCGKIRILEEKTMGRSRADVVMVTEDALFGLEIKSDADSYARLARQVRDYDRYFDFNYVVIGTRHAFHVEEHVPKSWGIITVEPAEGADESKGDAGGSGEVETNPMARQAILPGKADPALDFYILRRPLRNEKRDMNRKLSLLWRRELTHILTSCGLPKYSSKSKAYAAKVLAQKVPPAELDRLVSAELFERDYTVFS